MSKNFKRLIWYGCPICMGNLDYCIESNHSKKECKKCDRKGIFKNDPNKILTNESINKTLINNTKDDNTS